MEIKNEALKSLYEKLVSDIWSFSIEVAFKKCDDELEKEKEKLMKDLEDNVLVHYKIKQLEGENEELRKKCTYFEKLSTERLKATEELHQQLDTAEKEREAIREESLRNIREGYKTECDLRELRQKYDYLERSHKRLGDIRNRLAKENEDLKAKMDDSLGICKIRQLEELEEEIGNLREKNKQLNNDNTALQHTVDDFVVKCKDLQQQLDAECKKKQDLQQQVDNIGKTYCETARRVGELVREKGNLQRQIDILKQRDMVFVDLDSVKLTGMGELWAMIREVNSAPIEAIYGSGAFNNKICVGTILNMYPDVRDFVKEYKTWKGCAEEEKEEERNKQKRLDDMRDYLHKFCENRWCDGCPLSTDEFKCGRGYRFRKWRFPDNGAVPDEDLKRYYEKVRDWEKKEEQSSDQMRNWLESFCEKKEKCIGCPLESDEFKCGYGFHDRSAISDEELKKYYEVARATEKEHKFEYGDAVRVPWRDYDYMYIGPEAKHIRLFNPKTHTVVYVSPNEHLEFRNSRIIVCTEEDLKKIWKG